MATQTQRLLALILFFSPISLLADPVYDDLKKRFEGRGDSVQHSVIRLGDKTVGMHVYISQSFEMRLLKNALKDFGRYRDWLLPGVNVRPGGGDFRVKLKDFVLSNPKQDHLQVVYDIHFPFITYKGKRTFQMSTKETPKTFQLDGVTITPSAGPVGKVTGHAKFYQVGPDRVWGYLRGTAKLKHQILYEAMPEKVINTEIGARVHIFIENFFKEESRVRKLAKQAKAKKRIPAKR